MPPTYILRIILSETEKNALENLASMQARSAEDQAAHLIREALMEYGLITWKPTTEQMKLKVFKTAGDL